MSSQDEGPAWQVDFTSTAARQKKKLPPAIAEMLAVLVAEMEQEGPIQRSWSHFGPLRRSKDIPSNAYHCHLKGGRPTYVVCWQVVDKTIQIVEVFYVGTHENAPY